MMQRIHTNITSGRVRVEGPQVDSLSGFFDNESWTVSAEVFVPYRTGLRLSTHNGAIRVSDIEGEVQFESHNGSAAMERVTSHVHGSTHNGSIRLTDVGGNVDFGTHNGSVYVTRVAGSIRGNTYNGGIETELAGSSFAGRSVEMETHNGSINLAVPRAYSARVRADTHRGGIHSDFPSTIQGGSRWGNDSQEFNLGSGGSSPMRLSTYNGSIRLRQI
jgi:DUF4097 and DUF4098 domain-containing protein YvlB